MSAITTPSPVRGKRHCTCNKISILCPRIDRLARPFRSRPLEPLRSLPRLTSLTVGVPNVEETAAYYADFGLRPTGTSPDGAVRFATRDGGEQLGIVPASRRKLVRIGIGAHDADDIARLWASLARLDVACQLTDDALSVVDPGSALEVTVSVAPEAIEQPAAPQPTNGLGRHHIGSNFFWYLRDPAGNFSEYYSDLDCIISDALWKPSVVEGARGLYNWGPPPPPSFIQPDDLAELMTASHGPA